MIDFTYTIIFLISGTIKKLLNLVFTESQALSSCEDLVKKFARSKRTLVSNQISFGIQYSTLYPYLGRNVWKTYLKIDLKDA